MVTITLSVINIFDIYFGIPMFWKFLILQNKKLFYRLDLNLIIQILNYDIITI